MGRRRKTRTHVKPPDGPDGDGNPKSFIIKHGQVGTSLAQLVRDLRKVMEPNTASRLKERTRNKLKDYLSVAPSLHVTHLLAFTLTRISPSLRLIRLPGGPTLSFRVERYSLMKDILNTKKRARSMGLEYLTPPLLVLASFPQPSPSTPPHLGLLIKTFQSLFPPLSPQTLSLSSARRVVLVQYNAEHDTIQFRHYLITVKPYGVSRRVRKVVDGPKKAGASGLPDLSHEQDIADFLLRRKGEIGPGGDGYESATSASSAGEEEGDAISLADDYVGRNNKKGQRRAVRLDEIGPRMDLKLVKIVEGVPGREGTVLYHKFVKKTKAEANAQKKSHEEKERLRKQRKEEQERNVAQKKAKQEEKGKTKKGVSFEGEDEGSDGAGEEEDVEDEGEWDEEEEISEGEEDEPDEGKESSEDEQPVQHPQKRGKLKR